MTKSTKRSQLRLSQIALALGTAGLMFSASNAFAEEAKRLTAKEKAQAQAQEDTEVIEVTGVRSALESALNTKRSAVSIVDAISANDIDALPALDLGEALQAIPGIQLNSDGEGRQSSISLRGLGSGFVKTTAFGQSFATPSPASNLSVGSTNPFAAFESSVFDGVTVTKSPTADMQAGGVAGTVDKKLQQALSKKDGTASISIGGRYEELTGLWDPNVKLSGVKHLIDDKLAVAFKLGASGQTFRRDTFDVINYMAVDESRVTNYDAYRERYKDILGDDGVIRVPVRGRNVSEFSDGDRVSFSGNIEFRPTTDLKLGAHVLYSARNLDSGTKEASTIEALHGTRADRHNYDARIALDMDTAPFAYDLTSDAEDAATAFAVSNYDFENGTLKNENRKTTFEERTEGVILYADYRKDDWVLDTRVSYSQAENNFENVGISFTHNQDWRDKFNFRDAEEFRRDLPTVGTGFNGTINTGQGNLDKVEISGGFDTPYVYDDLVWTVPNTTGATLSSVSDKNQNRRLQFGINGRVRDLTKEFSSAEFNAQRFTDFGFGDVLRFESVKMGARWSSEELDSIDQRQSPAGLDTANLGSHLLTDQVLSNVQNDYFNGNMPGTFNHTNGWLTFDNEQAIAKLQENIVTDPANLITNVSGLTVDPNIQRNRTGFWDSQNRNTGAPTNLGFNFGATQDITALYLTTDFSGDIGSVFYSGNLGVRHERTENSFNGFRTENNPDGSKNVLVKPMVFDDSYEHTLPMANISFELTDDVMLRAAYYEGLVRPNLLAQTPTVNFRGGANSVTLDLPRSEVRPFEATNYDLSLEWYNREGSAISIGYFKKDISNLFARLVGYCPTDGSNPVVNDLLGDLERVDSDDEENSCKQVTAFEDDEGNLVNRSVTINSHINVADELNVEGFELAIQQNLDFLPYPWNGFGGVFNYTKLRQSGSEAELTRVSPESYNLIGYWENDGISLRLAYNWRDDANLQGANSFLGVNTRTRKDYGRLDFSGSYALTKKIKLFLRGYNLTDEVGYEYLGNDERALSRMTYTGRVFQVSASYKF
ncbi:TonB-dependent receptor [Catenovulum agarivorans]|uniref:TonB-dependent receptor n=1 Tax=Catenovulum agarivorans TaxID=1172192 RepID=UPI0002D58D70|nr:TonB-dependent receptor [Catenovulum agarivorans]